MKAKKHNPPSAKDSLFNRIIPAGCFARQDCLESIALPFHMFETGLSLEEGLRFCLSSGKAKNIMVIL